ncbi:tail fiber domain-containing protein [Pseudobdellovibrio sp. HCB154]|uniref:tail fiber domain-containing protein n=1 Tax=Pseudobdellovibrio sp. HCB154 TaxID=3386277 RepID=UPI003916DBFA
MVFLLEAFAFAAPFRTTYQAKIIKPDGQPLQSSSVNFKFTILDPAATCVIYSEDYAAVNMNDSGGVVAFSLGAGIRSFPTSGTASTFLNIFDNSTPSFSCQTLGVYMPTANDGRKIVMQFNDGTGWQTLPAMTINAVPYSMYAGKSENSIQLNGKFDTAFVQYSSLTGLNCQANEAIHFNGVSFSCLAVGGGSVTSGSVVTALGYTPADAASFTTLSNSLSTAATNISSVSSTLASVSSSVFSVSSTVSSLAGTVSTLQTSMAASFASITSSQWLTTGANVSYNSGNVGIGTSAPTSKLEISNGPAPLAANFDAIQISGYNGDWGYPVSASIGLNKTHWGNSYGEAMEFRYSSPDPGVLPPQYIFRGTSTTTDIYFNDGAVFAKTLLLNDYLHVTRKDTTLPATFLILPATNYTSYDFWQVHTSLGTSFSIGAVSAAGGVDGYYVGVTSGSFQIKTANQSRMIATNSGLVGIGTTTPVTRLEVSGGLRISMESASCTASFAGTLRYNLGDVEYCNGTSWQAFGTAGAVTSSSITSALGYSPVDPAVIAPTVTSATILTLAINNLTTSMFNLSTSATTMSTSIDALTASMASVVSSQWATSGSTINYMAGKVGIGTQNPTQLLDVSGADQNSQIWIRNTNSTAGRYPGVVAQNFSGAVGGFPAFNVLNSRGTSASPAPVQNGDVLGAIVGGGNYNTTPSYTNAALIEFIATGNYSATTTPAAIAFLTTASGSITATERMRIDSSGKVGIGTNNPSAELDVMTANGGYVRAGAGDGHLEIGSGNDVSSYIDFHGHANLGADYTGRIEYKDGLGLGLVVNGNVNPSFYIQESTGNVGIGTVSPTAKLSVRGTRQSTITPANSIMQVGGDDVFLYMGAGNGIGNPYPIMLQAMRDSDSAAFPLVFNPNGGNVGIGTSAPAAALHVAGSAGIVITERNSADGFGAHHVFQKSRGSPGAPSITSSGDEITTLWARAYDGSTYQTAARIKMLVDGTPGVSDTPGRIEFTTTPDGSYTEQTRMVIKNDGFVGIGTSTPTRKLHIKDQYPYLAFEDTENASGSVGTITYNQDGNFYFDADNPDTGTNAGFMFRANGGTKQFMTILNSGNVGIGTTAPAAKLDIFGATYFASRKGYANYYNVGPYDQMEFGAMGANTSLSLVTSGVSRLNITPAGYVGVNTTAPNTNLQLGPSGYFGIPANGHPYIPGAWRRGNGGGIIMANSENSDGTGWAYGSRMVNHDYGNGLALSFDALHNGTWMNDVLVVSGRNGVGHVGVGTALPSEKLHVVGNLRVQGSTDCTLGNGAGGTNCSSDARLKENIKPIPYALKKVMSLKGVEFDWNERSLSHGRHDIGVIAQDVEKVFPTAVMNDKNSGYKKVDYAVLVAPLIQAFKEFYSSAMNRFEKQDRQIASKAESAEVQALKVKTEKLEAENLQLKQRNEAIQTYLCSQNPSAPFCR